MESGNAQPESRSTRHAERAPIAGAEALRRALQSALARGAPDDDDEMRRALAIVGAEVRRRGLFAEQVVIALKAAWHSLPEVRARRRSAGRDALLERLVTQAISTFYRPDGGEAALASPSAARAD